MADGHWVSNWYLNATGRSAQEYQGAINLGNFKRAIDFHGSMTASQMNYYLNGGRDPNVRCTLEGCVGSEVDVGGIAPGIPLPTIPPEMITAAVNGFWDVAKAWLQTKYPALRREPGKPTAEDGYTPPKKWDGKLVKNPNGPGAGYPDKDGNVWVPTGTGGAAHGGPHWDVQKPGGGYVNVYPGGKVR
jgi:hypothetical protein